MDETYSLKGQQKSEMIASAIIHVNRLYVLESEVHTHIYDTGI
jgi:hypothetical protein